MNYRHSFHAGNFGDVLKHVVLTLVIEHLKLKPTPFAVIDTHAGTGRYDLQATESARTGEYRDGIARVLAWRDPPAELAPYLAVVRAMNEAEAGRLRWYPGSPRLARALMRRGDRLFATELHPADFAALAAEFANDRRTKTIMLDGYQALAAFVPPRERRAVVLVDPLLAGAVDPVFLRAGAVAPDFGSSSARPLDPQAATVIMSAATSKRRRDLRR